MNFEEIIAQLEKMGTAQNRKIYKRHGADENLYGVSFANLNKLKKKIKFDSDLAVKLWQTGNVDAMTLATMIYNPSDATPKLVEAWMKSIHYHLLIDLFVKHVVSRMVEAEDYMNNWIKSDDEWYGRAGWTLLAHLAMENNELPDEFFFNYIIIIKESIHDNINRKREAMNTALIAMGGRSKTLKKICQDAAKKIGKVSVDYGETSCKTPDAHSYIDKIWARKK